MKGKTQKRQLMTFLHIFHIWPNGKWCGASNCLFCFIYFHSGGFILSWMLSRTHTKVFPTKFIWTIALNCLKSMLCEKTIFIWNNSLSAERVFFCKNWIIFIITHNILSLSDGFVFVCWCFIALASNTLRLYTAYRNKSMGGGKASIPINSKNLMWQQNVVSAFSWNWNQNDWRR